MFIKKLFYFYQGKNGLNKKLLSRIISSLFWSFFPLMVLSLVMCLFSSERHDIITEVAFILAVIFGQVIAKQKTYSKDDGWAVMLWSIVGFTVSILIASFYAVEQSTHANLIQEPIYVAYILFALIALAISLSWVVERENITSSSC